MTVRYLDLGLDATSKGVELSYDLDYAIVFCSWILSTIRVNMPILWKYSRSMDIICISWIYPSLMDILRILWTYPHSVNMICIVHILSYLAHNVSHCLHSFILVVNIIYIGHITSYLDRNVRPIFHIYSSSESYWCITYFPVCNLICFSIPFFLTLLVLWVSINWIITLSRYMGLLLSFQSKLV